MPQCKTSFASIAAIHSTLGPIKRCIDEDLENFGGNQAQIDRIKKTIGLNYRYVVGEGLTALDLCEQAAKRVGTEDLDAIVVVTQTPDHFQPCNAAKLHGRLGLSTSCACFDVSLGCSGWVYGLYLASLMVETGGCERVLLAAGDTMSRCVHPKDRSVASLFGDAGTATIIERTDQQNATWFNLHTDGTGWENIQIPAGGFRQPTNAESSMVRADAKGNSRNDNSLAMDGAEVFNFSIKQVPAAIQEMLESTGMNQEDIGRIVLHQANRYIIGNIARRTGFPLEKSPTGSVERFGNLSSASIPTAICDEVLPVIKAPERILCAGFGVGLSWATVLTNLNPIKNFGISHFGDST